MAVCGLNGRMYVLTLDQVASRSHADAVPALLERLASIPVALPFERTAGDEVQGVLDDPAAVIRAWEASARAGQWSTGIGIGGDVELGDTSRASRGGPFLAARAAVEDAKGAPARLSVRVSPGATGGEAAARDAEALLRLLALHLDARTEAGWRIVDAMRERPDGTQEEWARALGITRQAVSKALRTHHVREVDDGLAAAGRLLARALARTASHTGERS